MKTALYTTIQLHFNCPTTERTFHKNQCRVDIIGVMDYSQHNNKTSMVMFLYHFVSKNCITIKAVSDGSNKTQCTGGCLHRGMANK